MASLAFNVKCQNEEKYIVELNLNEVITLAIDSSLDVFIAKNNYMINYWLYENYKASKLPFIDLNLDLIDFSRAITEEYNFVDSSYQFIEQQTFYSDMNLSINQNISKTGARLFLDSDIGRLQNIKQSGESQYSTTIIRAGIRQELFGFNSYKWDDKIYPLKYEIAKKEFVESLEDISLKAIAYFFDLARAQVNLELANKNLANADTLFKIGKKKNDIAAISQEDLFILELNLINCQNQFKIEENNLRRAQLGLNSFLRLSEKVCIHLILPKINYGLYIRPYDVLNKAKENNKIYLSERMEVLSAAREVDKTKREASFNSTLSASFGLNQTANTFVESFKNPINQENINLTLKIPILDWGISKGQYRLSLSQQEIITIAHKQAIIEFEQNVLNLTNEFNIQKDILISTAKADTISQKIYNITKSRFLIDKVDLTKLGIAQNSVIESKNSYLEAMEKYWYYYYTLRKVTLYDYVEGRTLENIFDEKLLFE
jgi:outer membrane protein TolC